MKPSQMPEPSQRAESGWRAASQPLKSPMTETEAALGAQTAKWVPSLPSMARGWAPSLSQSRKWLPSLKR